MPDSKWRNVISHAKAKHWEFARRPNPDVEEVDRRGRQVVEGVEGVRGRRERRRN